MKRALPLILALLLLLTACGKHVTPQNAASEPNPLAGGLMWQEQYDLGMRYLTEGNYAEAIVAFTAAIEIDPKQVEAYIGRAEAYIGSGETEEYLAAAQKDYETVLTLDEANADGYLGLADVYIRRGDYDKALEVLQTGLDKTGGDEAITAKIAEVESNNDPFTRRENYKAYEEFPLDDRDYIGALINCLKSEDQQAIAEFAVEREYDMSKVIEDTSYIFNYLIETDGRERIPYFGHCYTYTMADGYKLGMSSSTGEGMLHMYDIEIHAENGRGYYLDFTRYDESCFSVTCMAGDCREWNWNGSYWWYNFDNVRPHQLADGRTAQLYEGNYETGTAVDGLVDGEIYHRVAEPLEYGVDNPLTVEPATPVWHFTLPGSAWKFGMDERTWYYNSEDRTDQDWLKMPTGYSVQQEAYKDNLW